MVSQYRIAGKFGEELNLADWRFEIGLPNYKFAYNFVLHSSPLTSTCIGTYETSYCRCTDSLLRATCLTYKVFIAVFVDLKLVDFVHIRAS